MAQLKVISNQHKTTAKAAGSRSREVTLKYMFGEDGERAEAVSSIGCTGATWQDFAAAFEATCVAHSKFPRVELYHLEQSFSREEADPDDPEAGARVNALGVAFARRAWPGRQVVVVTQKDGKSGLWHNHMAVNNPHPVTGLMCRGDDMTWSRLMPLHDQVLVEHGYQQPDFMPTTVLEAKARAAAAREGVHAEGEAIVQQVLSAGATSLESFNDLAPEGVGLIDEPWELRAKKGKRPDHGRRMRIKFTDSEGRPRAFDVARLTTRRDAILEAFAENARQAALDAQQTLQPVEVVPQVGEPVVVAQEPAQAPVRPVLLRRVSFGMMGSIEEPDYMEMMTQGRSKDEIDASIAAWEAEQDRAKAPAAPEPEPVAAAAAAEVPAAQPVVGPPADEVPVVAVEPAAPAEPPYRSPLRSLRPKKPDPKRDELVAALAVFDEEARVLLARGARPVEARIPKGVGPQALSTLGPHMDPLVREQLKLREAKKQARHAAHQAGEVELKDRLTHELDAGVYEDVDAALAAWQAAHPEVTRFDPEDREAYLVGGPAALDELLEQAQRDKQGDKG